MKFTVRKAVEGDIQGICFILKQALECHHALLPDIFSDSDIRYSPDELDEMLDDSGAPIFVAVNENHEVVGYAICFVDNTRGHHLKPLQLFYIDGLCVREDSRRQGIGSTLLAHCKNYAQRIKCDHLIIKVYDANVAAKAFYEANGMKVFRQAYTYDLTKEKEAA